MNINAIIEDEFKNQDLYDEDNWIYDDPLTDDFIDEDEENGQETI
jgi:hypothetical protein